MALVIFFTATLLQIVRSELLATTNSFTTSNVEPTSDGIWTATMTCHLVFPGKSVSTGNTAHVYTRFGVPITSYTDNLGGVGAVETDPEGRWVIAVVGDSLQDSLSYWLDFTYTRWLGNEHPKGDCRLYSSMQEAVEAKTIEDNETYFGFPETTAADPFLSNASVFLFDVDEVLGRYNVEGWCDFSFPGIKYGLDEAYVIINYRMDTDVGSYSDDQGGMVLMHGLTGEFTLARMHDASFVTSSIVFYVATTKEPIQMESCYCLLYSREADARAMVETLYQVTEASPTPGVVGSTSTTVSSESSTTTDDPESSTTTDGPESPTITDGPVSSTTTDGPESSTTTDGPESLTITDGSASSTTTDGPASSTITDGNQSDITTGGTGSTTSTGGQEFTATALHHDHVYLTRSTNTGSWMREYQEARGRDVDGVVLWEKAATTYIHGARLCIADPACIAVLFHFDNGVSLGFSSVSTIGERNTQTKALLVFE